MLRITTSVKVSTDLEVLKIDIKGVISVVF